MNKLFASELLTVLLAVCNLLNLSGCSYNSISDDTQYQKAAQSDVNKTETITTWGWYEESFKACFAEFSKLHPGIKLSYTQLAPLNGEYMQKVQSTIASGNSLPDILWGERSLGLRGQLFDYDIWEDLSKAPYNVDMNNFFDYTRQMVTDSKGRVCGLDWELDAAGIAYKRDMAKMFLGTDEPEKLEAMLGSWDSFIDAGKKVYRKSGGKVTMLSGLRDAYTILIDQNAENIAVKDTINTNGVLRETFEMLSELRTANILGKYETWTPSWRESFSGKEVIFYPCATWSVDLVIKPNDKYGSGNWGLIVPPGGGFATGGTTFGITRESKHKDSAWKFLSWFLDSEEGAEVNKKKGNHFTPLKSMYNKSDFTTQKDIFFNDQDLGEVWFKKITPSLKVRSISKYDQLILDASTVVMRAMAIDSKMDAASALKMWKEVALQNNPDLKIR